MLKLLGVFLAGALPTAGLVFLYVAFNPEKAEKIGMWFYRGFSWVWKKMKYGRIATELQATVNSLGRVIDRETGGALPHAMKIEWVKEETPSAFFRAGQVIVRLKADPNDDANFVNSTLLYLSRALLPESRIYPPPEMTKAIDFVMTRKIAFLAKRSRVITYFVDNIYTPAISKEAAIAEHARHLERMDEDGIFTRIFLRELGELPRGLKMRLPDEQIRSEIVAFADFLTTVAEKTSSERVALEFIGENMRINILLVAEEQTLADHGTLAHERRLAKNISEGCNAVYICAASEPLVNTALAIARRAEKQGIVNIETTSTYTLPSPSGRANKAVCIRCRDALQERTRPLRIMDDAVIAVVKKIVPEVANGDIEVVSVGRVHGAKCKIAVRARTEGINAVGCCIGPRGERAARIKQLLGEPLDVLEWVDDPVEMAISALRPMPPEAVREHVFDLGTGELYLLVDESQAGKAIGLDGCNVTAANRLADLRILILSDKLTAVSDASQAAVVKKHLESPTTKTLDTEIMQLVRKCVPEVATGEVEVRAIGRVKGAVCKVAVRANSPSMSALSVCIGRQGDRVQLLRALLRPERIGFVEWTENVLEMAVRSLYPLDPTSVVDSKIGHDSVAITVRTHNDAAQAIGRAGSNIRAARELLGFNIDVRSLSDFPP